MQMTTNTTSTFLDRFSLHLAGELLGVTRVAEYLKSKSATPGDSKNEKTTSPLYWRSNLLLEQPSELLQKTQIANKDNLSETLLFIDLSFSLALEKPKPQFQVSFGLFVLQERSTYLQSVPLTQTVLENHAEAVGIDLHSAPPRAMASMMAQELLKLAKPLPISIEKTPSGNISHVSIQLHYHDVGEAGPLAIEVAESTTGFDRLGRQLLYHNFQHTFTGPKKEDENADTKDSRDRVDLEKQLDARLEEWLQEQNTASRETKKAATQPAPTATAKRPAKSQPYARLRTNKRAKKGKIVYAKPK